MKFIRFLQKIIISLLFSDGLLLYAADLAQSSPSIALKEDAITLKINQENLIELCFDKSKIPIIEPRLLTNRAFMDKEGIIYLTGNFAFRQQYILSIKNGIIQNKIPHHGMGLKSVIATPDNIIYFVGSVNHSPPLLPKELKPTPKPEFDGKIQVIALQNGTKFSALTLDIGNLGTSYIAGDTVFLCSDPHDSSPATPTHVTVIKNGKIQDPLFIYGLRSLSKVTRKDNTLQLTGKTPHNADITVLHQKTTADETYHSIAPALPPPSGTLDSPLPDLIRITFPSGITPTAILANAALFKREVSKEEGMEFYNFLQKNAHQVLETPEWLDLYIALCESLKNRQNKLYYYVRSALASCAIHSGHPYFDTYVNIPGFKQLAIADEIIQLGQSTFNKKLARTIDLALFLRDLKTIEPDLFTQNTRFCFATIHALSTLEPEKYIWQLVLRLFGQYC